jgi:tetratricopeptide (TPR) repeat protein
MTCRVCVQVELLKTMTVRPLTYLLAGSLLLLTGCLHTDSAIVRSDRPSMAAYGRTTEPNPTQVLDLVAGERAAETGAYDEAIRIFEDLLSENPTLTDAYLGLGGVQLELGDYQGAEVNFARAARLEPRNFDAQFGHGQVLEALEDYSKAIRAYQRALTLRPDSLEVNVGLSNSYFESNQPKSAIRYAEAAVELEPERIATRLSLAAAYQLAGRFEDAISQYEVALELGDTTSDVLLRVIGAYMKAKRWQEAANAAETLVKIAPTATSYERLGRAYFRLRKYELSMEAYQEAVDLDAQSWPSLNGLGVNALNAWLNSDRTDEQMALTARDAFRASLQVNPDQPKLVEILTSYSL